MSDQTAIIGSPFKASINPECFLKCKMSLSVVKRLIVCSYLNVQSCGVATRDRWHSDRLPWRAP